MTTFELPPEPPIGSRVRDASGNIWTRGTDWWEWNTNRISWRLLLTESPLTLIEPDPWPTAPLIVATRGGPVNRRGMFARWQTDEDYVDIAGVTSDDVYDLATRTRDTLTNVVPVKPVPVAELDALRENMRAWDEGGFATLSTSARNLLAATDALGLDQ